MLLVRGERWPRGRLLAAWVGVGLGLFAVPAVLVEVAQGWVPAFTRVVLFSLTPVFAVVLEPYLGVEGAGGEQTRGGLLAALAAVGGALCIFPVELPGRVEAAVAVAGVVGAVACLAAANCFAVRMAAAAPAVAPLAAVAGGSAALGLLAEGGLTGGFAVQGIGGGDFAWAAVITLPVLVLLFWLLPRMPAAGMTARFVVVPLAAVLFSIALDRPAVDMRTGGGLVLMAAGAGWLLFGPAQEGPAHEADGLRLNG